MRMPVIRRHVCAALVALGAALPLAACGEDEVDSGSGSAANSTESDVAPAVEDLTALLARAKKGTSIEPSTDPRPAAKGKTIVIVSSGQNSASTAEVTRGNVEACKALGWRCSVLDGKSDPTTWPGLYRQAIAQKPDGIIGHAIDCQVISRPLEEAKKAGIPTVGQQAYDCDEPSVGGKPLFSGVPLYPDPDDSSKDTDLRTFFEKYGAAKAAAVLVATKNKPNAIVVCDDEVLILKYTCDGTLAALERAPDAKVTRVDTRLADLGPKLESQVSSALLPNPEVNAIFAPHGSASLPIASAVQKAGKKDKIFVMGNEGLSSEYEAIKSGQLNAAIGAATEWIGWAGIDTMNSLLTDKPIATSGIGWLYVDEGNVPAEPAKGLPAEEFPDFQRAYQKAWGV